MINCVHVNVANAQDEHKISLEELALRLGTDFEKVIFIELWMRITFKIIVDCGRAAKLVSQSDHYEMLMFSIHVFI
jgi:hypothetical protein